MYKISSPFTFIYKFICLIQGIFFLLASLFFLYYKDFIAFIILLAASILFLKIAKKIKFITIKNNHLHARGFFSKKQILKDDIIKVGSIFLFFYLKTKKEKIYFMNTLRDQMKALSKGNELVEKEIINKIRTEK